MEPLVECIPNVSEGRDRDFLNRAQSEIEGIPNVHLLDSSMDADHHRSVFTLIGSPKGVTEGTLALGGLARKQVDLRKHRGQHPRIGALDVVPFVPIAGVSTSATVEIAQTFGRSLWVEHGIPSYFYGWASDPPGKALEDVRRGGFESLIRDAVTPDVGDRIHPTAGATGVGARKPLIAWNVELATPDPGPARRIAKTIRASAGGLPAVKALGLALDERGTTQVSMNLTDYEKTSPATVFQQISELAEREGVAIIDTELIGLIPNKALGADGGTSLRIRDFNGSMILEQRIEEVTGIKLA